MSAALTEGVGRRPISIGELPERGALRILPLPDLHLPGRARHEEKLLGNREFLDRQDWVVLLGDMICCYGTPAEYGHVRRFVEAMSRPYSAVNGNHEFVFKPTADGGADYGKVWEHGDRQTQGEQLGRFERFFGLASRFQAGRHGLGGFCLLGIDEIADDDSCRLTEEHERWLEGVLWEMRLVPLVIFCHFPIADPRLDEVRYYVKGRRPYYIPSPGVVEALGGRSRAAFWFSGHLHFAPTHPLFDPYLTPTGVWQVHCPDGAGYGRRNNDKWHPEPYEGLVVREIVLEKSRLSVITTDVYTGVEAAASRFDLG